VGSPLVGREEDGIIRYHFVHHGGIVTRSCTRTRRTEEGVGKVGKEEENYGWCMIREGLRVKWKLGAKVMVILVGGDPVLYRGDIEGEEGGRRLNSYNFRMDFEPMGTEW